MKPRDVFIIALRILGIVSGFRLIAYLIEGGRVVMYAINGSFSGAFALRDPDVVMVGVQLVLFTAATLILIFAAPRIANFFYRDTASDDSTESPPQPLRLAHFYRIGAQLLGLYAWFQSIQPGTAFLMQTPWEEMPRDWGPFVIGNLLQAALYLGLGVYLVFGSRGLARALARMQYHPPKRAADAETNCIYCGYDLRGLSKPRCPECGREFDKRILEAAEAGAE